VIINMRIDELRCFQFPGEISLKSSTEAKAVYAASYACWKKVWLATFKELDGAQRIFSDDFTRQTKISAILYGERCVALGFLRSIDFTYPTSPEDSYFKVWSDDALAKLVEDGKSVLVASNLTVDPDYRGDVGGGIHLKNLVVGLVTKNLIHSSHDVMTGTMRCDRGAHRSAYLYGATPIQAGVTHHGVDVDLVGFYRRRIEKESTQIDLFVERLWKSRTDLNLKDLSFEETQTNLPERKAA
jgi:hypothetical protein